MNISIYSHLSKCAVQEFVQFGLKGQAPPPLSGKAGPSPRLARSNVNESWKKSIIHAGIPYSGRKQHLWYENNILLQFSFTK